MRYDDSATVITDVLNADKVVCTLQDAELRTVAHLSTADADVARIAAKRRNEGLLQRQHTVTLPASTDNEHVCLRQICISLSQANMVFSLNKTEGGSSSDGNTISLAAKVESTPWHLAGRERSLQE